MYLTTNSNLHACFKTRETKPNSALPAKLAFLFSIFNLFIPTLSQLRRDVMWLTG